ncbi:MAG: HEAT repeat domain-containing protein [Myxococcales bacterium]|nr:HEAT repeat domain-containing protein [Myxococcales bacterium]
MSKRRRKPRLFSFSRDVELANFDEVVTDPGDRDALSAVIDAFIEIAETKTVTDDDLESLAAGARHPSEYVRGVAITRLTVLTHYFAQAVDLLDELTSDPDESVRLFAVSAAANTPAHVGQPAVARALSDSSWRVRKAAAQTAGAVAWPDLLPSLTARTEHEPDARVRVVLQLAVEFLRRHAEAS